jgi:RNA polymerase sigma-70 factor (ECF subfamily)
VSCQNDQEKFMRFWTTSQPAVVGYIRSLVPGDAANDVVQNTALALFRRFADYDDSRPFTAWAMGVAKFQILGHRRDAARSFLSFEPDLLERFTEEWADACQTADYRATALEYCLDKLSARARKIVRMRYFEGLTGVEIGSRMGSSDAAIRMMLQRIRDQLRKCTEENLSTEGGAA